LKLADRRKNQGEFFITVGKGGKEKKYAQKKRIPVILHQRLVSRISKGKEEKEKKGDNLLSRFLLALPDRKKDLFRPDGGKNSETSLLGKREKEKKRRQCKKKEKNLDIAV